MQKSWFQERGKWWIGGGEERLPSTKKYEGSGSMRRSVCRWGVKEISTQGFWWLWYGKKLLVSQSKLGDIRTRLKGKDHLKKKNLGKV